MNRHSSFRRGFTLIELLVVISIISLLISILLPALASSRKASVQVTCLTRIRSQTQALSMYQSDMKECYPYGQDVRVGSNFQQQNGWRLYYQELLPYLGRQITNQARRDGYKPMFHCPVIWDEHAGAQEANSPFGLYNWNPHLMGWINASGYHASGNFSLFTTGNMNVRSVDIDQRMPGGGPSRLVIFTDGFNITSATPLTTAVIHNSNQTLFSAPHFETRNPRNYQNTTQPGILRNSGGKLTVAFMDGHARVAQPTDFPTAQTGLSSWMINP